MNELFIEATLDNLGIVLDFIGARLKGVPRKIQNQISISVDEIFSNIARYAYHPETGGATVRISVGEDITVEFEDSGIAYDPLRAEAPDITLSAEDRELGGLGLFMVKNMMDSMEYRRDGNKNILTIKKRRGL